MYHIIICDDNQSFINYIKGIIIKNGIAKDDILFYEYLSGDRLINNLDKQHECDLLILDMQMEGLNGHATAAKFREKFPKSLLIFCSGVCKPTDESFKTFPFRYLYKSYDRSRMSAEIRSVVNEMISRDSGPFILGKYYYSTMRFKPDDILYIENTRYGSIIYSYGILENDSDKKITNSLKVDDLYPILQPSGFEIVRYGVLVNMKYIIKLDSSGNITLIDHTILTVSRSNLKRIREVFAEFISRKY